MDFSEYALVAGLTATIAAFVAYWVARLHQATARHVHLGGAYRALLHQYIAHPRFVDESLTRFDWSAFEGEDFGRYHCFALRVHTFLDVIYDFRRFGWFGLRPQQDPLWEKVFDDHLRLHGEWLKHNHDANEAEYVDSALDRYADLLSR